MKKGLIRLAVAGALVLGMSGSVWAEDKPATEVVAAVVNGDKIYLDEVQDAQYLLPPQFRQMPFDAVYGLLLNSVIDRKLTAVEGRKKGLQDNEEVKKQLARIEDQLIQRAFLGKYIEEKVTEEKVMESYKKYVDDFKSEEEVHARHILLETEEQAQEVISELEKGKDFAETAKSKSKGPSGANGGDLGYFTDGAMVPPFSKAAFALGKGEITKTPVQTQFGWHVIKVEDKRKTTAPALGEIRDQIEADLARDIGAKLLDELRGAASIERFGPDGKPLAAK